MTPTEQNIFFELLRASIWQRPTNTALFNSNDWAWAPICKALESHALLALAADAIMTVNDKLPSDKQLNPMQSMAIYQHSAEITQTHYELNIEIAKVFTFLKQKRSALSPVLLKGQGLATLYPLRNTRSCGDIDIYIGKEHYIEVCHLIDDYCGNPYQDVQIEEDDIHYKTFLGKVEFEIHHSAAYTAIPSIRNEYNNWASSWLQSNKCNRVKIEGVTISVPPYQFYVIYIFEHLLKHLRYEGVGIRQFIDWLILLRNAQNIDVNQLKTDLKHFHLLDAWQVLGGILVYQLGLPTDMFPLWNERKAKHSQGKNLQFIIECGNFGENIIANRDFANMPPSMHRNILAFKYYISRIRFEYHLLPWDTPRRFVRQLVTRLKETYKQ